jgi:hypothetical protein
MSTTSGHFNVTLAKPWLAMIIIIFSNIFFADMASLTGLAGRLCGRVEPKP